MEEIKIFVEDLLSMTGLTGSIIPVLRSDIAGMAQ